MEFQGSPLWNDGVSISNAAKFVQVIRRTHLESRDAILDVGCGRGWLVKHLQKSAVPAVGVDIDSDALRYSVCDAKHGNLNGRLPFDDGSFGMVICLGVLGLVPQVRLGRALLELARVSTNLMWINLPCKYPSGKIHFWEEEGSILETPAWWRPIIRTAGWEELNCGQEFKMFGYGQTPERWTSVWKKKDR
jgi:SAM-dependent methyltransferase